MVSSKFQQQHNNSSNTTRLLTYIFGFRSQTLKQCFSTGVPLAPSKCTPKRLLHYFILINSILFSYHISSFIAWFGAFFSNFLNFMCPSKFFLNRSVHLTIVGWEPQHYRSRKLQNERMCSKLNRLNVLMICFLVFLLQVSIFLYFDWLLSLIVNFLHMQMIIIKCIVIINH